MIYYTESPIKTWQPNLIMLDLNDDFGHVYVTRNTYNQAVLISDRYSHDITAVQEKLGLVSAHSELIDFMSVIMPEPINILAPFYDCVDKDVSIDMEDIKQCVGVLSYLSMNLDFNMMLKVDKSVRSGIMFTKSILLDYQGHYEDFLYRIFDDSDYIYLEAKPVDRSKQEDFILQEEEEEQSYEDFLQECGFNDVEIPTLQPLSTSDTTSTTQAEVNTVIDDSPSEAEAYEALVASFT